MGAEVWCERGSRFCEVEKENGAILRCSYLKLILFPQVTMLCPRIDQGMTKDQPRYYTKVTPRSYLGQS